MAAAGGAEVGLYQLVYICDRLPPIVVSKDIYTFGRAQECDLSFVTCKYLSGHHCNIKHDEDSKVWLCDTSTNGTLVNGSKVKKGQRIQLNHNDEIHLVHRKDLTIGFVYQDLKVLHTEESTADIALDQTQEYEEEANTPLLSDQECSAEDKETQSKAQPRKRSHEECASTSETEGPSPKRQLSDTKQKEDESAKPKLDSHNSMAETLLCSICQDIFHDCVSLQPCMHSFCASCYSQWMAHSNECPSCRNKVVRINKNHIVNNLVEIFLKENPDKRRPDDELKEMDAKNKITSEMLKPPKRRDASMRLPFVIDDDYDDDDNDDSDAYRSSHSDSDSLSSPSSLDDDDDDDDDDGDAMPRILSVLSSSRLPSSLGSLFGFASGSRSVGPVCRQCPSYVPPPSAAPSTSGAAGPSTDTSAGASCSSGASADSSTSTPYTCTPSRTHILCLCCNQYMPDRRSEASSTTGDGVIIPPMTCTICRRAFCHLYWGCGGYNCQGCLNNFKDLKFRDSCLAQLINSNASESKILKDYLTAKGLTLMDLQKTCLEKLDSKDYTSADSARCNLTSSSVTCYKCGLRNLQDLAYQYRRDIPAEQLPASVTSRPDCYWGKNCRTQKNKAHHAERFNHICEQTRFT